MAKRQEVTVKEAAKMAGRSERTIQLSIHQGKIEGYKDDNGHWHVYKASAKEFAKKCAKKSRK